MNQIIAQWSLLQRPINALIVLDTSGSMDERIPALNATRLQLLQRAATKGLGLLNNVSSMSLWQFSSKLTPTADYRELVPLGPATGRVGAVTRREALVAAHRRAPGQGRHRPVRHHRGRLRPDAEVLAAQRGQHDHGDHRRQERGRRGPEPGPAAGPSSRASPARTARRRSSASRSGRRRTRSAMQRISEATGGRTFPAKSDDQVIEQIVLAFAGRLR